MLARHCLGCRQGACTAVIPLFVFLAWLIANVGLTDVPPLQPTPSSAYDATAAGEGSTAASNTPPSFDDGASTTRAVDENAAAGANVGAPVAATDPDADESLTYALGGTDAASFAIVESSGQLKTKATLDHETTASYSVTVEVVDNFNEKDSIAVTINVNDVNEAPVFPDGAPSLDVNEDTGADVAFGDPVTATDPDNGATLMYSLSGADAASFAIVESSGQLKTKEGLNYEGPQNVYDVIVIASDGALTDSVDVSIAVNDVKEAPGTPDAPTVEAAATDGHMALDVTWTAPSNTGPAITGYDVQYRVADSDDDFADASHDGVGLSATITGLSPNTTYEVQVRATNDEDTGAWSTSGEGATGAAPNNAPAFIEGDSASRDVDENTAADVAFGDPVAATDADSGDTLSYSLSGKDAASFAIVESSGQLKTKATLDYETKSSYSVEVRVDDGFVVKGIAVTIDVNDVNEAPVFPDGAPSLDVNEDTGADVAFGDPVTATDPDSGDTLTYSLSGTDANAFAVDPSTGQLKTKGPLNYEGPQNVYDVVVIASDGSLTASVDVSIAVNDVKEPPGAPGAPTVEADDEDELTALDVSWTAPSNTGPPITDYDVQYRVADSGDDFTDASHDGATTQTTITELSPNTTYEVQVRATNDEDTGAWSASGEGTTGSANNEPAFPEGATATRAVDENTAADVAFGDPVAATDADSGDTLSYSLSGADAASFAIVESSGQLKTKASLDYEAKASYSVEVRVDDGFVVKSIAVAINVNDVNEAPVFPDGAPSFDVNENTMTDVAFGDPVTATDPDSGATLTYSLSGADADAFTIVESTGQLKTKAQLNYEGPQNVYEVIVIADDGSLTDSVTVSIAVNNVKEPPGTPAEPTVEAAATDGHTSLDITWTAPSNTGPAITDYDVQYRVAGSEDDFADSSHDGVATQTTITDLSPGVTYEVQVRATNDEDAGPWSTSGEGATSAAPNNVPAFIEGDSASRDVDENTAADVAFGDPVAATDADSGDTLSYSLSGKDAASFAIVESSGQLKTKATLDYEAKASYSVEVRVDDGFVVKSIAVAINVNDVNEAPVFPDGAPSFDVNENTMTDVAFGDPVTATDPDSGATLTYSLSGADADAFTIVESTGQLKTKAQLNYEGPQNVYEVIVIADDGSLTDSVDVSIAVNDVKEAPGTPDAPTVEADDEDELTSLDVTWTAPSNTGPAITDYDVQYRVAGSEDDFAAASHGGVATQTTITDLSPGVTYEVQVRATNDEDAGPWSTSGEGATSAAPNNVPAFIEGDSASRDVDENTAADVAFGDPVAATDADSGDTLSYSLSGKDAASFAIVESSGQLKTKATLDYEAKASYSVTVTVRDGKGGMDSIDMAISVNDLKEAPGAPDMPMVAAADDDGHMTLNVSWAAPSNTGPPITGYDVQYRVADSEDDFAAASHGGVATQTTITDLSPGVTYEVQVRATNDEDTGLWSTSGVGATNAGLNNAPAFTEGESASRDVDENTAADVAFGDPVAATDADSGDTLSYSLAGADAASFAIVESSGQLKTKASLNYEVKASYSITMTVRDGNGGADSIALMVNVSDVDEPPGIPGEPTVAAADDGGHMALNVSWTAPSNTGPPITDYDVQYRVADSGDDFADASYDGVGVSTTITGLSPDSTYEVQVRATNDEGMSSWSNAGVGSTSSAPNTPPVFTEGAVAVRTVGENTKTGQPIGDPVAATDTDGGDTLRYWLSGGDTASFDIVESSGQLRTKAPLNYEDKDKYSVTVSVDDGFVTSDMTPSIDVTINVNDLNEAPVFADGPRVDRNVAENTAEGKDLGAPVKAKDPDSDALRYTLGGTDADSFDIDSKTGQLKTKAALDYEERTDADENSEPYTVTITASDDVLFASIDVSIAVTDLDEPPERPAPPTVAAADEGGHVALDVTWTAPPNAGPPITGYDVQYRVRDSRGWSLIPSGGDDIRGSRANIANLTSDTAYKIQVRARNDEGVSGWSVSGTGRTNPPPNNPPVFKESARGRAERMAAENAMEASEVGAPVTAEDADDDKLTYSLSGTDADTFDIDAKTGQLKTKASLDYEAKSSYSVEVRADDGKGGMDSIAVTIKVTDMDEPPGAPDAPTARADGHRALVLTWTAPENEGRPAITGYDVQYRVAGSGDDFSDASYDGVGVSATITGLSPSTTYGFRVRARNDEGYGDWSDVGEGRTSSGPRIVTPRSNRGPVFKEDSGATRAVDENTAAGQPVGSPVAAVDSDRDTLVYSLNGKDAASFDIDTKTGQIETVAPLDYETRPAYEVIVEVRDGNGGEDSIAVAIGVRDVNEPPIFDDGERATRRVVENAPADVAVGAPVAAADPDEGDTLSYTLWDTCGEQGPSGGLAQEKFDLNSSTGGLTTKAPLDDETRASYFDYEAMDSYLVAVHVRDFGGEEACIEVTIEVADAPEPPGAPSTPVILPAPDDGHLGLHIGWDSLPDSVRPAVTGYEVQYRRIGDAVFSDPLAVDHISVTITGLEPDTDYEAQVRAVNAEGKGPWSHSGVGRTEPGPNRAPSFEEGSSTARDVDENTPPRQPIGASVVAVDPNPRDRLRYWLSGADADAFAIVASSGRIRTRAALDYETKDRYSVRVNVEDGEGGADSIRVWISVNDVDEPPGTPDAPTAEAADDDGQTTLVLTWTPPPNTGPPVTDYDVQHRLGGSGGFTDASYEGVGLSAIITSLSPGSAYEARVRATNDEGTGEWSASGEGSTALPLNNAPSFNEGVSTVRAVDENTPPGQPIGAPVAAADPDSGDVLTYSLTDPDASAFAIEAATGQVVTNEPINHEAKSSYSVTVVADDGKGGAASIVVAIDIADVNEPPVAVEDSATTDEDTAIEVPVLENDSDEDAGASLSIASATQPRNGGVIVGAGGGITYTPNTNFHGEDLFTYVVSDGAAIATGSVNVAVNAVNDAPVAVGRIPRQKVEIGGGTLDLELSGFFSDPDGDSLVYAAEPSPAIVTVAVEGSSLAITPAQAGETTVAVTASDPDEASIQGTFELIAVNPVLRRTASQTVALVVPGEYFSVMSADGGQTVTFPAHSRASPFQVRVDFASENCATGAPQGARMLCISVELFDLEANRLDGGLDQPATLTVILSQDQSRSVQTAYDAGRLLVMKRGGPSDAWVSVPECAKPPGTVECFMLTPEADGKSRISVINIFGFSEFALVTLPPPPPKFIEGARATRAVAENSPSGVSVGSPVVARAGDGRQVAYTVSGADADLFEVSPWTGQIVVASEAELDHESADNPYTIEVAAHDGVGESKITVRITAANVAELGSVTLSPEDSPEIGATITAMLADPDGGVISERWQWEQSTGGVVWADVEGATSDSYVPAVENAGMLLRASVTYDDAAENGIRLNGQASGPVPSAPRPTPTVGPTATPTPPTATPTKPAPPPTPTDVSSPAPPTTTTAPPQMPQANDGGVSGRVAVLIVATAATIVGVGVSCMRLGGRPQA